jgi:hypothetical protein
MGIINRKIAVQAGQNINKTLSEKYLKKKGLEIWLKGQCF